MALDFNTMKVEQAALIKLFATRTLAELESDSLLIKSVFNSAPSISTREDILNLKGYNDFYSKLREVKIKTEDIFTGSTENEQVKCCLAYLNGLRTEIVDTKEKRTIFKSLIQAMLDSNSIWIANPPLVEKYKKGVEMIEEWVDFFLSYTNRDQPSLNNQYLPDLERQYKKKTWSEEVDENNMVAKLIVKHLKYYNNLNAFFDKESMICGEKIADEVFNYCEKTFAFAQLIEPMIFSVQAGAKNWCYEEYRTFISKNTDGLKKKFFFQSNLNPGTVPASYSDWHQDYSTNLNYIIKVPLNDQNLHDECIKIAKTIKETKETAIANYISKI